MSSKNIFPVLIGISLLVIAIFGIIRWLDLPAGTLIDWSTGLAAFWLLLGVTVVPWDMYFKAREIIINARLSREKDITIQPADERYAQRVARVYLVIALVLHLVSAATLYALAHFNISTIGYWASIIALMLTFVRPLYRLHEYIVQRLSNIGQSVLYPREDAVLLRHKLDMLEERMLAAEYNLDAEREDSLVARQQQSLDALRNQLRELRSEKENMLVGNQAEHQQLSKKIEDSLSRLSEDAQFLNQVRELIRFVKNA